MSKPCWLFVDAVANFGGHEAMLLRWLEELRDQDLVRPVLLARNGTPLLAQAEKIVETLILPGAPGMMNTLRDAWHLSAQVRRLKPDLSIVAEGCWLSQAWATATLRLCGQTTLVYVALINSSVEMNFRSRRWRDFAMHHFYRYLPYAWITLSSFHARHFRQWTGITTPIFTLPNTVAKHFESAKPVIHTSPEAPLRALILGRLDAHQKGLEDFLRFLENHLQLAKSLRFTLAGDGPDRDKLKARLDANPALRQIVALRPWADSASILREHHVVLLPSNYEGVPLVMLEAMALGIPVIASDLPGTREFLSAENLFKVGDYTAALKHLHGLLNQSERSQIALRNRAVLLSQAGSNRFSRATRYLTEEILKLSRNIRPVPAVGGQSFSRHQKIVEQ
jgi:glycosyltransferase involved in cell wall biosynthesis